MKIKKLVIAFLFIVSIFLLLKLDLISLKDIDAWAEFIQSFGYWAFLVYLFFCIISSYVFLPLFMTRLIGMIIFGTFLGSILNILGMLIGAICSFFSSRYFMTNFLKKKLEKNKFYKKISSELSKHGGIIIFITRSNPFLSNSLQNYIYGLSDISVKIYIFWTLILYVLGTTSMALWIKLAISDNIFTKENILILIFAILLVLVSGIFYYIAKKKNKF